MSDSVGGSAWDGTLHNNAQIVSGSIVLPKTNNYRDFNTGSHARLPNGVLGASSSISLEMWVVTDKDNKDYCKLFQIGDPVNNCPSIHCYRHTNTGFLCCARCGENWAQYQSVCTTQVFNGSSFHFIHSIDPAGQTTIYVNGELSVSKTQSSAIRGRRPQDIFLLGAAPVLTDYTLWGSINEFRIWSDVFNVSTARASYRRGPDNLHDRKCSFFNLTSSL
jgi:hypothetical protein